MRAVFYININVIYIGVHCDHVVVSDLLKSVIFLN